MIDRTTLTGMRFGFGLPLPAGAPTTPEAMLDALGGPDRAAAARPGLGFEDVRPVLARTTEARIARRADPSLMPAYETALREAAQAASRATRIRFARALDAPDGFRERLVNFWADHFTTRARNRGEAVLPETMVNDAVRPNLTGRFADLLRAATLHPAMLTYLDQVSSIGPGSVVGRRKARGLNENLAREAMELHTLGVGADYTQADVRQMALLLTGLDATAKDGFAFRPARAEPGAETVLGKTYGGDGLTPIHAVLDDLAARPETARHIARKLAVHFVSDTPDETMVGAMTQAFSATGGDLMAVYAALLHHPAAWEPILMKARQPQEFLLAAFRALGQGGAQVMRMGEKPFARFLMRPMALMGQAWQMPSGPDGWAEGAAHWISPQGLGARIAWAMEVPGRLVARMPEPRGFAVAALGGAADDDLLLAVSRAESVREGVGLALASPAFNRR